MSLYRVFLRQVAIFYACVFFVPKKKKEKIIYTYFLKQIVFALGRLEIQEKSRE